MRVLAAVVTYNRARLLERCVDHLRLQKRAPDAILVINNSSPDDTVEMLERKGVDYITQPNLGGAGGFARAIEEAGKRGFDAVWLMDDDGYPHEEALGHLVDTLADPALSCACSLVVRENQPSHFVWPFPLLDRDGLPVVIARKRKLRTVDELRRRSGGVIYPFGHLFNGTLVRMDAVKRVGTVDTGFFIMGDELDFAMRLIRERSLVSHLQAFHLHPDVGGRPLDARKFYFYVKNTIIVNNRYANKAPLRNLMAVAAALGRTAARNSPLEALNYLVGRRAPVLWKAITRGMRGNVGNDFNV
jgi:GT2 family glycosyltransferase